MRISHQSITENPTVVPEITALIKALSTLGWDYDVLRPDLIVFAPQSPHGRRHYNSFFKLELEPILISMEMRCELGGMTDRMAEARLAVNIRNKTRASARFALHDISGSSAWLIGIFTIDRILGNEDLFKTFLVDALLKFGHFSLALELVFFAEESASHAIERADAVYEDLRKKIQN